MRKPYFDPNKVPAPEERFVAWLNLMGAKSLMASSLKDTSTAIFKTHVCVLDAVRDIAFQDLRVFPVMDGVYITSTKVGDIKVLLASVLRVLSNVFLEDSGHPQVQFMVKASVAKGPVYRGEDLLAGSARRLDEKPAYRDSLLIGMPVANAYLTETSAPPFGVAIHDSAKSYFGLTSSDVWWSWFYRTDFNPQDFYAEMSAYFSWCRHNCTDYKPDRITVHDAFAKEYFLG